MFKLLLRARYISSTLHHMPNLYYDFVSKNKKDCYYPLTFDEFKVT